MSISNGTISNGNYGSSGQNPTSFLTVQVATTANINLSSAPSTIDGYSSLVSGKSLVLVKNQTPDSGNGNPADLIYVWNGAGQAMTLSMNLATWDDYQQFNFVIVLFGTTNGGTNWINNAGPGGTLGITNLLWIKTAGVYTSTGAIALNNETFYLSTLSPEMSNWINGIDLNGNFTYAQPAFSNLNGNITVSQLINGGVNGANQLVQTNGYGELPALNGSLTTIGNLSLSNTTISNNDSLNTAFGKTQGQISALVSNNTFANLNLTNTANQITSNENNFTISQTGNSTSVIPYAGVTHQFLTVLNSNGTFTSAQPAFSDISGTIANSQTTATSLDTPSTIVSRDSSGNFSAGSPTFNNLNLNNTTNQIISNGHNFNIPQTSDSVSVIPNTATTHQFVTNITSGGAINLAQPSFTDISGTIANSQTTANSSNASSTIVARDSSGNFSAGTITANLTGIASGNQTYISSPTSGDIVTVNNLGQTIDSGKVFSTDATFTGATNNQIPTALAVITAINNAVANALDIQGTWNASTNTPTLTAGTGTKGYAYYVSTAGSQTAPSGTLTYYAIGDLIFYTGTIWDNIAGGNTVASVNGFKGIVSLGIANMNDASIITPSNGQSLFWNNNTSNWDNALIQANNITVTPSAGYITISIPQSVATTATPTFSTLSLTSNSNPLVLGTTNTMTFNLASQTANNIFTLPNSNCNPVIPASAATNQFATGITSGGVINFAQPAFSNLSGKATIAQGGTNSSTALNNNSLMYSTGGAIVELGQATNGQIPIGSTGNAPVLATLTGTTNQINVTNSAGAITLSLPQFIATTSTPTFNAMILSGVSPSLTVTNGTYSMQFEYYSAGNAFEIYSINGTIPLNFVGFSGCSFNQGVTFNNGATLNNGGVYLVQKPLSAPSTPATGYLTLPYPATDSTLSSNNSYYFVDSSANTRQVHDSLNNPTTINTGTVYGTANAGTNGTLYAYESSTAITTNSTQIFTFTLNIGTYFLSYNISAQHSSGTTALTATISIGGTTISGVGGRTGAQTNVLAGISYSAPIKITSNSTVVNIYGQLSGISGSSTNNSHNCSLIQIC